MTHAPRAGVGDSPQLKLRFFWNWDLDLEQHRGGAASRSWAPASAASRIAPPPRMAPFKRQSGAIYSTVLTKNRQRGHEPACSCSPWLLELPMPPPRATHSTLSPQPGTGHRHDLLTQLRQALDSRTARTTHANRKSKLSSTGHRLAAGCGCRRAAPTHETTPAPAAVLSRSGVARARRRVSLGNSGAVPWRPCCRLRVHATFVVEAARNLILVFVVRPPFPFPSQRAE
jgi:hypothetical protein